MENNIHHHFWEARQWRKYRLSAEIRNHELSKSVMVVDVHNDLHRNVPSVPPPEAEIGRLVLSNLNGLPRHYSGLESAKYLYDKLYEDAPKIAEHLERQIPYLELSAKAMKKRHVAK